MYFSRAGDVLYCGRIFLPFIEVVSVNFFDIIV